MNKVVNKEYLTQCVSDQLDISKQDASAVVDRIFDEMSDALANDGKVDITGFGKFELFYRKERNGINPNTKEKIRIAASYVPKFRASQTLKQKCNTDTE